MVAHRICYIIVVLDIDSVIEIINAGWTRDAFYRSPTILFGKELKSDRYCMIGAMGKAWHDSPNYFATATHLSNEERQYFTLLADRIHQRYRNTNSQYKFSQPLLDMPPSDTLSLMRIIIDWNDKVARDRTEVVSMLLETPVAACTSQSREGIALSCV